MKEKLPSIQRILTEPTNLSNNETVAMFLELAPEDTSSSDKVLSTIEILNEFYNNAYSLNEGRLDADIVLSTLVDCFESTVSKLIAG